MGRVNDFKLVILNEKEYNSFLENKETNNFLQSLNASRRYKEKRQESYLLGLKLGEEIVAAGLVVKIQEIFKKKIYSIPGGPILDYNSEDFSSIFKAFTLLAKIFLSKQGGSALLISPNLEYDPKLVLGFKKNNFKELGEYIYVKWIELLNLDRYTPPPESLLKTFRQTTRQNIRRAFRRYNLEIRELEYSELEILSHFEENAARKHNFNSQPLSYFQEMFRAFGKNLKVVAAFYEKVPISAAMFILYNNEIVYLYSGSDYNYNKYCGSYAIQWFMIKFALENNYKIYNFYGVRPFPGDGVYEFKKGFRSETKELIGTFILPLDLFGKIYARSKNYQKFGKIS